MKKVGKGVHIVKRRGHKEKFDERKVYASCYAACLSSHMPHERAEIVAANVSRAIKKWVHSRAAVTSDQIFRELGKALAKYDKDAAFMYRNHRDIS